MRAWTWWAVAMLGLVGCGADPIARAATEAERNADLLCVCPQAFGTSTEAECRAIFESAMATPAEQECLRRVYGGYAAELDPVFDCGYEAGVSFRECMLPLLTTCPPDSAASGACSSRFNAAFTSCPRPSAQAMAELNACFASRT
jgi:hypothetical protein